MKKIFKRRLIWLSILFFLIQNSAYAQSDNWQSKIEEFPEIISVQKIEPHPFFKESYEVLIEQYLDHSNPQAGKFAQRVIVSNYNKYSPVIFVTEGYDADYAVKSTYINELSKIIEANQLIVEHRYFGKSAPSNINWEYLNIKNACDDLHRIQRIFKRLFNNENKWIATGISKGGQNTIAYKAYYPEDMDIWIPYVGPLNFAVEDKRIEDYLSKIGTPKCQQKIEEFQLAVLKNRDNIQPLIDSLSNAEAYTYSITNEAVLDFCVLEYSFSFWQWENSFSTIPADTANPRELFNHLIEISNPDYFAIEEIKPTKPFFIQAVKEFGYYGYDTKLFEEYLSIDDAENYIEYVFLADEPKFKYSKKTSRFIKKSIRKNGSDMILIYGEYDPWTGAAITSKMSKDASIFIKSKASHRTRINNMSYAQRAKIYMLLETLLEQD